MTQTVLPGVEIVSMNDLIVQSLLRIFQRRKLILGVMAITFGLTLIGAVVSSRSYNAEVVLAVNSLNSSTRGTSTERSMLPMIEDALSYTENPKVYQELAMSKPILAEVHAKLEKEGGWKDGTPPRLKDFIVDLEAEVEVVDQTARPINYSPLLTLSAVDTDPERVTKIVNTWAQVVIDSGKRINTLRFAEIDTQLQERRAEALKEWNGLGANLYAEKAEWNVDVMKERITLLTTTIEKKREEYLTAAADATSLEQRLAIARTALAEEPKFLELLRGPSDDVYWMRKTEPNSETTVSELTKGLLRTEVVNDVRSALAKEEDTTSLDHAQAVARSASLKAQLEELETQLKTIQSDMAKHELVQLELGQLHASAKDILADVTRLHDAVKTVNDVIGGGGAAPSNVAGLVRLSDSTFVVDGGGNLLRLANVFASSLIAGLIAMAVVVAPLVIQFGMQQLSGAGSQERA